MRDVHSPAHISLERGGALFLIFEQVSTPLLLSSYTFLKCQIVFKEKGGDQRSSTRLKWLHWPRRHVFINPGRFQLLLLSSRALWSIWHYRYGFLRWRWSEWVMNANEPQPCFPGSQHDLLWLIMRGGALALSALVRGATSCEHSLEVRIL